MNFFELAKQEQAYMVALRRHFHRHPEVSLQEFETAGRIEAELDALQIPHVRVGQTGVAATLQGRGEGAAAVVLRADIDALPMQDQKEVSYCSANAGAMHACGHDAHTAALLGAARLLAQNRESFGGQVRLFFQQGEEIGEGARLFVKQGLLKGARRVFGLHVTPLLSSGKVAIRAGATNASVDYFKITVQGKAAHVSTPQKGADALYIATQIVNALQGIATRRVSPVDDIVIGVGTLHAGTSYNIVAGEAVLEGTTRAFVQQTREEVNAAIEKTAHSLAALYGAAAAVEWKEFTPALINHQTASDEAAKLAVEAIGQGNVVTDMPRSLGGDNFADFLQQVPGVYAYLGTASPKVAGSAEPLHSTGFDLDESVLWLAAGLHAQFAWQTLANGQSF
ncbi:MAG: M20 family metallopeptidase [Oscillospiraceae bacterium]